MNDKEVLFDQLNADLIAEYEAYLKGRGNSPNTVSFYMRILKAVYNRAVEDGLTEQRHPFKSVYTGVEKTLKRAISLNDLKHIKGLDLSLKPNLDFARDMFLFCFYTRGMSFIDMAYLRKKDLQNGILSYRRRKTGQQLFIKWERCMQDGTLGQVSPKAAMCQSPSSARVWGMIQRTPRRFTLLRWIHQWWIKPIRRYWICCEAVNVWRICPTLGKRRIL